MSLRAWHIDLGDRKVGPLGRAELYAKAAVGALHEESLARREGETGWKRVADDAELLRIVQEGRASARASWAPRGERGLSGVSERPVDLAGDRISRLPRARYAWLSVLAALGLGVAVGFAAFYEPRALVARAKAELEGYEPRVPAREPESELSHADPPPPAVVDPAPSAPESARAAGEVAGGVAKAKPPLRTPTSTTAGDDTPEPKASSALSELRGREVPAPAGSPLRGDAAGSDRNSGLTANQIQTAVSAYRSGVRRSCWQPALATRSSDAATTARVVVSLGVLPSGAVDSVTTSGDPRGYPGLAACLAAQARAFRFPRAQVSTRVSVPFVFAAQ